MAEISIEQIEEVLDKRVRPDIKLHGGDIQIAEFKDDILSVRFLGCCSGCPSADLTMETLVESELKEAFPEIKHVVLVTGVSDNLIDEAKKLLRKRHGSK